jgi:drug/metabolite transporter (DMT)-like permease
MPKLIAAGVLIAVGLIVIVSQVFRSDPNVPVFFGGLLLCLLGGIGFSDSETETQIGNYRERRR